MRRDPKTSHAFKLGPLTVRVRLTGTDGDPPRRVYTYRVEVASPRGVRYGARAWGSIANYERKDLDFESIGAMVADELRSAKADPDEFLNMAGKKGRVTVRAAEKFTWDELDQAAREAESRGLV